MANTCSNCAEKKLRIREVVLTLLIAAREFLSTLRDEISADYHAPCFARGWPLGPRSRSDAGANRRPGAPFVAHYLQRPAQSSRAFDSGKAHLRAGREGTQSRRLRGDS